MTAAAELFATTDPDSISLRQIAEAANVSYSLIHRHFGTKTEVVAATVRHHSASFAPSAEAQADPVRFMAEISRHYLDSPAVARALAWATLNGADPVILVEGLTDVESLVDQMAAATGNGEAAVQWFALAACMVLGVGVYGPLALTAAGGDTA